MRYPSFPFIRSRRGPAPVGRLPCACGLALLAATLLVLPACQSPAPDPAALQMVPVPQPHLAAAAAAYGLFRVDYYDRSIDVQLVYATPDNVFGRTLYPPGFPALLSRSSALKLAFANSKLQPHGLRLQVLDAYRPPEVQWHLFKQVGSARYVADPRKGWSKHTFGRAVDVTLIDENGRPLRMPSAFDDFTEKASARYRGNDPIVASNLARLQEVMTQAGFSIYEGEWWHFNDLSNPAIFTAPPIYGRDLGLPTL